MSVVTDVGCTGCGGGGGGGNQAQMPPPPPVAAAPTTATTPPAQAANLAQDPTVLAADNTTTPDGTNATTGNDATNQPLITQENTSAVIAGKPKVYTDIGVPQIQPSGDFGLREPVLDLNRYPLLAAGASASSAQPSAQPPAILAQMSIPEPTYNGMAAQQPVVTAQTGIPEPPYNGLAAQQPSIAAPTQIAEPVFNGLNPTPPPALALSGGSLLAGPVGASLPQIQLLADVPPPSGSSSEGPVLDPNRKVGDNTVGQLQGWLEQAASAGGTVDPYSMTVARASFAQGALDTLKAGGAQPNVADVLKLYRQQVSYETGAHTLQTQFSSSQKRNYYLGQLAALGYRGNL